MKRLISLTVLCSLFSFFATWQPNALPRTLNHLLNPNSRELSLLQMRTQPHAPVVYGYGYGDDEDGDSSNIFRTLMHVLKRGVHIELVLDTTDHPVTNPAYIALGPERHIQPIPLPPQKKAATP